MTESSTPNTAPPAGHDSPTNPKVSGLAITAMILGIMGLCLFPFAIAALIIGIIALNQIADIQRALTGRGMALVGVVTGGLGVVIIPFLLILGILLPALGAARITARKMKGTTQARGQLQAMVVYASGNRQNFPGLDSKGRIVEDTIRWTGSSGHGATVEARYWILLDENSFTGDYIISPAETKTAWKTGSVSDSHYSYALLNIDDGRQAYSPGSSGSMPRPNAGVRARAWRASISSQAAMISDRARRDIGTDYEDIYSVHTSADSGTWEGSVAWGDGAAAIENSDALNTKYDNWIEYDRIFTASQADREFDVIAPGATWDKAANALLGYTDVGFDESKDVVSK